MITNKEENVLPAEEKVFEVEADEPEQTAEPKPEEEKKKDHRKKERKRKQKKELTPEEKQLRKKKTIKAVIHLCVKIVVITVLGLVVWFKVGELRLVHNQDMYPALKDGDLCVTYKLNGYYNGDVILYKVDDAYYFGRVVGIPGDVIDITEDGIYTVNGSVPYESVYYSTKRAEKSSLEYPYEIEEGTLFVLNDYREQDKDSRIFGGIVKSDVHGKVVLILRRRGI